MRIKLFVAVGIGCPLGILVACASANTPQETVNEQTLALLPCNLNAAFKAPTKLVPEGTDPGDPAFAAFTSLDLDGLTFSASGDKLYASGPHMLGTSYDIMRANRLDGGAYTDLQVVDSLTTMGIDDRAPFLRANGQTLYLHRPGTGGNDIYSATLDAGAGEFFPATPLAGAVNTPLHDQDPFYLEANNNLFFASERNGSTIKDIYRLTPPPANSIIALPTGTNAVNHPNYDDYRPVLTSDGLVLYFASKRPGIGGDTDGDIWMATRTNINNPFGAPVSQNILNRSGRDFPVAVSADQCTLYIASNQDTGLGGTDHYRLYKANRGENVLPSVSLTIQIAGTGSVTTPPFNCSHVGPGFGGTGTCSASAAPGTVQAINVSGPSTWTGSCTGTTIPDSNGYAIWAEGGVCKITIQ